MDGQLFFVLGCLEIPVIGEEERLLWNVWVSVSEKSFAEFTALLDRAERAAFGPYFGWLSARLPLYPDTENLKTLVHLRDGGLRPSIELEPTNHPLALEQREGITVERVAEIYSALVPH